MSILNQTFHFPRFMAFMRQYLGENKRKLLLYVSIIIAAFLLVDAFILYELTIFATPEYLGLRLEEESSLFFIFAILFGATLGGSLMYSSMNSPSDRLVSIEMPASQFEKWLTFFLIYCPGLLISLFIGFYIGYFLLVAGLNISYPLHNDINVITLPTLLSNLSSSHTMELGEEHNAFLWIGFLLLQSTFALGSIVFHKLAFIKTYCFLTLLQSVCVIIFALIMDAMTRSGYSFYEESISQQSVLIPIQIAIAVFAVGLQWLAYARFKESETVNRW